MLSDPAMEEALHDVPQLAERILATINTLLSARGLMLRSGTVVDAMLISAPSSTQNASGEHDPEMKQSRTG